MDEVILGQSPHLDAFRGFLSLGHTTEQASVRQLDFPSQIQYINPASAIDATKT